MIEFISTIIALAIVIGMFAAPIIAFIYVIKWLKSKLSNQDSPSRNDPLNETKQESLKNTILAKRLNAYQENRTTSEESIIDVSNTETPSFGIGFPKFDNDKFQNKKHKYWVNKLEIPYKRWFLNIPQCELETMKLYADLAEFTDQYLRKRNSSLINLKSRLDRSGGYYSNILYTLECIAEGEVERFYKKGRGYDNEFSFSLLKGHIDDNIISEIKEYLVNRVNEIESPDENTIRELRLTKNGLPYVWWDADGTLREKIQLDDADYYWLQMMQYRQTKFLDIEQCRVETTKLYLRIIKELSKYLDSEINQNKITRNYLSRIFKKNNRYNPSHASFLKDIFKLSENEVREVFPQNRKLNTVDEHERIKKHIGSKGLEDLLEIIDTQKKKIAPPNNKTLSHIYKENPSIWRSLIKDLKKGIDDENIFNKFKDANNILKNFTGTESYFDIAYQLSNIFAAYNKVIALFFYYKHFNQNPKSKQLNKKVHKILFKDEKQFSKFIKIASVTLKDKVLLEEIKGIYKPKRKKIKIDLTQVNTISEKHSATVSKLNTYIDEAEETEEVIKKVENKVDNIDKKSNSLDSIFDNEEGAGTSLQFDSLQISLLDLFAQSSFKMAKNKLTDFAAKNNQLPNSIISKLNQIFYDTHEDNLITETNEEYLIDAEYIPIIKKTINGNTN